MRMICIVNNKNVTSEEPRTASQGIMSRVFFNPSFLGNEELRLLCRNEHASGALWKSYMQSGSLIFEDLSTDEAFNQVGCALQLAHYQLISSKTPTWRWAMRLIESTNMIIIILRQWGHQALIRELTATIEQQILSLPYLRDCPDNKGKVWLCRWCRSMNCPKRQQTLARLYSKNKALTKVGQLQ
ncbi:MAG: hypothetical protein ACR2PD_00945 [Luminiphilus sp.]